MKKSILMSMLLMAAASLMFWSCQKDDLGGEHEIDLPKIEKEYLYGKWVSDSCSISFDETGSGSINSIYFKWYLAENNELVLAYDNSFVSYIITELTSTTLKMYELGNKNAVYFFTKCLEIEKLHGMWQLDESVYYYNKNGEGCVVDVHELENVGSLEYVSDRKDFLWKIDGYNLQLFTEEEGVMQYYIDELTDSSFVYRLDDDSNKSFHLVRYVFHPNLANLYGRWRSGSEYYVYHSDGSGLCWNESYESEEEAQNFTWEVNESVMMHIYKLEMGGDIPMCYIITELTASTLKYYDTLNMYDTYSFIKVH